jgi:UDP-glucose 4-epimerase
MKKKVLVTGGTGYIGSHTIIDLLLNGFDVICADSCINSDPECLKAVQSITGVQVPFYKTDLCNIREAEMIFNQHPDLSGVIHFAALKAVGESVEKPLLYFKNNLESLMNVLALSLKSDVSAFVFSSSCTVYGDVQKSPVDENTPLQEAASPYGRTKQIGEQIVIDCLMNAGLKGSLLRYFNPAGAHPSGLIGESPVNTAANLVPVITETAIGKRTKLTVFGNDYPTRDGSCIRDYIHVCDLAHAHTLALSHIFMGKQEKNVETFNLGIGSGLSVLEVIRAFEKVSGMMLPVEIGPRRPGDVTAIYADPSRASRILGWSPVFSVDDIMHTAWIWEKRRSGKDPH